MPKTQLSALAKRAKLGFERSKKGRSNFIAGTFELAAALLAARKQLPADRDFSTWLDKAGLKAISKDDRAALITIGANVDLADDATLILDLTFRAKDMKAAAN